MSMSFEYDQSLGRYSASRNAAIDAVKRGGSGRETAQVHAQLAVAEAQVLAAIVAAQTVKAGNYR